MVKSTYKLYVDWNNDGDFKDTGEDVSARTINVDWELGRDSASIITGRSISGKLTATLNNESGDYSISNTSSPLSGNLLPGRKVRLTTVPPLNNFGRFDGASGDIEITDDSAIQNIWDAGGTVEFLMRPYSDGENNGGRILEKRSGVTGWFVSVSGESGGKVKLTFQHAFDGATSGAWSLTTATINLFRWTHVAITYNSSSTSNNPTFWIDGVENSVANGLVTESSAPDGTRVTDVGQNLYIGNRSDDARTFHGDIDDVRLWSDTRTSSEIDTNKWLELVGNEAGLVGYWQINESSGSTIDDLTANSNDGTATGIELLNDIQWTGFLDSILPSSRLSGLKTARLSALGGLAYLNKRKTTIATVTDVLTGTEVGAVLDDAGWPSGDRQLDTGITTLARFLSTNRNVVNVLREIEFAEGGFIAENKQGDIVFEDRHHRLQSPHTVSRVTISDDSAQNNRYNAIKQESPLAHIRNELIANVKIFTTGALADLWTLGETGADSPFFAPGESKVFWANFPNPGSSTDAVSVDAWTTPVSTTDYTANTDSGGGGTDLTASVGIAVEKFSNSMKITITNNHASLGFFLTLLKARGTPVSESDPLTLKAEDSSSQTSFGKRTFSNPTQFFPDSDAAQDWANFSNQVAKDPQNSLSVQLPANKSWEMMYWSLDLDISDRITLEADNDAGLGIDEDFFIEAIAHSVNSAGIHYASYLLSPASLLDTFWIMDVGQLGTSTMLSS